VAAPTEAMGVSPFLIPNEKRLDLVTVVVNGVNFTTDFPFIYPAKDLPRDTVARLKMPGNVRPNGWFNYW